jgi:hypothetical protein
MGNRRCAIGGLRPTLEADRALVLEQKNVKE